MDTCDLKSNMYTVERMTPKRIDFIFFSDHRCPSTEMEVQVRGGAVGRGEEGGWRGEWRMG